MRLWTICSHDTWQALQERSVLLVDDTLTDSDFRPAYDWMREQMFKRVPGYQGHYPWWGYYLLNGRRNVSLRQRYLFSRSSDKYTVLLDVDIPRDEVLLSDYEQWSAILNGVAWWPEEDLRWWHAIPRSTRHERELKKTEHMDSQTRAPLIKATWENVFRLEYPKSKHGWGWGSGGASRTIQACYETLRLADVRRVREFRTREA